MNIFTDSISLIYTIKIKGLTLINDLKKLKQQILTHKKELEKISPYIEQTLETISVLIKQKASDTMINLWQDGALELISDIEAEIEFIQYNQKVEQKIQLLNLKEKIDTNIKILEINYPISQTISEAIEVLLDMNAPEDMIRAYLNGLEDYIKDIDKELR